MNYLDEVKKTLYKFKSLGEDVSTNGATLIGKAPFIGSKAWLNIIYPKLDNEQIECLESDLKTDIPAEYKTFLLNFSNGLGVLSSTFSLYGLRNEINRNPDANIRLPYSIITPNIYERPKNSKESYFFIGGYNWDGSHLYIDKETNIVHCCERWDSISKIQWPSFEQMITSELKRLYGLFDNVGKEIDEDKETIPY